MCAYDTQDWAAIVLPIPSQRSGRSIPVLHRGLCFGNAFAPDCGLRSTTGSSAPRFARIRVTGLGRLLCIPIVGESHMSENVLSIKGTGRLGFPLTVQLSAIMFLKVGIYRSSFPRSP